MNCDILTETGLTSVARIFVSLLVAFSYPILALPGRNSVLGLWRGMDSDEDAWLKYNKMRYIVVTVSVYKPAYDFSLTLLAFIG